MVNFILTPISIRQCYPTDIFQTPRIEAIDVGLSSTTHPHMPTKQSRPIRIDNYQDELRGFDTMLYF